MSEQIDGLVWTSLSVSDLNRARGNLLAGFLDHLCVLPELHPWPMAPSIPWGRTFAVAAAL